MTKEERREYNKNYVRKKQTYTPEQKEAKRLYKIEYYKTRKVEHAARMKIYNQKPDVKQRRKIIEWKRRGLICDDYNAIYQKWFDSTNCEECNIEFFSLGYSTTRCMDHSHTTGEFRNIICHSCNTKRRS
mgnify:FL=1